MSAGLPSAFERLLIEAECARLVMAYSFFVDRRRYGELVELFTEDAHFERPGVQLKGAAAIRSYMDARSLTIATRHSCAQPFFEKVEADEAVAVTYMTLFQGEGSDTGPNEVSGAAALGEFHDVFRRTATGWRIARHVAKAVMIVRK